jgi:hypothetical protein
MKMRNAALITVATLLILGAIIADGAFADDAKKSETLKTEPTKTESPKTDSTKKSETASQTKSALNYDADECQKRAPELIKKHFKGYKLKEFEGLGEDLQEMLISHKQKKSFNCVIGDFDGDGAADYAFQLSSLDGKKQKTVILVTRPNGKDIKTTYDEFDEPALKGYKSNFYLEIAQPGLYQQWDAGEEVKLAAQGVVRYYYNLSCVLLYWKKGKIEDLWLDVDEP